MQVDLFQTMVSLYRHNGVQTLLFKNMKDQISQIDYGFRGKMASAFDYERIAECIEKKLKPNIYYLYEDDLGLYYSLFRFPPESDPELSDNILCLGPILFRPVSQQSFQKLMDKKRIPILYHQDFMEYFNQVPILCSIDSWNHMLVYFLSRLYPGSFDYLLVRDTEFGLFSDSYEDYSIPNMPDVALNAIETRYQHEDSLMKAVSSGNIPEALNTYHYFLQYRLLPRVPDPVRDRKNLMFTFNTLLRKAAQNGNVHPLHIDNLSREFAIQIEAIYTMERLDTLAYTMIRKYCMLVNNYSRRGCSSLVQTCLDYIDFHYSLDLSLNTLAAMCSVTGSYLSTLFKKETGVTITDYINTTRIRQSLILLNSTNLSISEIAARCGFVDANYYSRIFKKFQGKTPKHYRESVQKGS